MDIDSQLLSKSDEEKAGELRASKRAQGADEIAQEGTSFREQIKAKRGLNIAIDEGDSKLTLRENPFRKMTDGWLKGAWENLIPSWGLTLLYIDAHAFLNKVFGPKYFRELGGEWVPAGIRKLEDSGMKKVASMAKIIEPLGCAGLNLIVFFLILLILTIISILTSILTGDLTLIWELFKDALSEIKNLFS